MKKFNNKDILAGIGELPTDKQKTRVRTKLKSETLFSLRLALEKEK